MKKAFIIFFLSASFVFAAAYKSSSDEAIKIAAMMDLTGTKNSVQAPVMNTIKFAVNQANSRMAPLEKKIELIEIDTMGTVIGSRLAAKKTAANNVSAVIGPLRSSNAMAAADIFQKASVVMISPTATNPLVTRKGDYIFRTCYTDQFQGRLLAAFALSELNSSTAVVLTNTKDKYCIGLADSLMTHFRESGGEILYEGDYLEKVTDFDAMVKKAGQFNPDVIFIPGFSKDAGQIIKKIRRNNITATLIGGDGWGTSPIAKYAGDAVNGSFRTSFWHPDIPDEKSRAFVHSFEKRHGPITRFDIASAYDAVMILAEAILAAESADPRDIRNALSRTTDFKGITGRIRFDENGDPLKPAVILTYVNTKPVYYKTVFHETDTEI